MTRFATGRYANGACQRCGLVYPYLELRADGYQPGLRVCEACYDPPRETYPSVGADAVALKHPSPRQAPPEINNPEWDIRTIYSYATGYYSLLARQEIHRANDSEICVDSVGNILTRVIGGWHFTRQPTDTIEARLRYLRHTDNGCLVYHVEGTTIL